MTNEKLALLRLAAREFEGISSSCEMFLSNGIDADGADAEVWALLKKASSIQDSADKIRRRLEKSLEKYEGITVKEIY